MLKEWDIVHVVCGGKTVQDKPVILVMAFPLEVNARGYGGGYRVPVKLLLSKEEGLCLGSLL
jgi:hypothetical protein